MSKSPIPQQQLAFIGAGYVGLVSGTCLANIGHNVILVDKDAHKIDLLKKGEIPIYEPGLKELVEKNTKAGRLAFTTKFSQAVEDADVIFIAVNTPPKENGEADLTFVDAAAKEIAKAAKSYKVVVNKSTVPVATGERVARILQKNSPLGVDFDVVSNPEFLREGSAIRDFAEGDRVIIGINNNRVKKVMEAIYSPLNIPIFFTDVKSAELIKYASNSFLATKISFINAVARICELTGGNIDDVSKGMGLDKRISPHFLNAGLGYAGSCFPKDVAAFIKIADKHGYDFHLLQCVEDVNAESRTLFLEKIKQALGETKGKTIAMWGLAFKPNTDDMRCAASITLCEALTKQGVKIQAYDPEAQETAKTAIGDKITYAKDKYEALQDADALVVVTEWDEFRNTDWEIVRSLLKEPIVIDGRNVFSPAEMEKRGFVYHSIGRG